jgi:hypothetical protein
MPFYHFRHQAIQGTTASRHELEDAGTSGTPFLD